MIPENNALAWLAIGLYPLDPEIVLTASCGLFGFEIYSED
jgi:hypothetical protein